MNWNNNISEVLLDVICCVMCADRKITKSERKVAHIILAKMRAPWDKNEVDRRIDAFIRRAKREGLNLITQETCQRMTIIKTQDEEQLFLKCIDYMTRADGIIHPKEVELCQTFRSILTDEVEETLDDETPSFIADSNRYASTMPADNYPTLPSSNADVHKWEFRLAFSLGHTAMALICFKGMGFTIEVENKSWKDFEYYCNELGLRSDLRDYLRRVGKVDPSEQSNVFNSHVLPILAPWIARDMRYIGYTSLGAMYLFLSCALQQEAQGLGDQRQFANESFESVIANASQAMLPMDIIKRLGEMQQIHNTSADSVTLNRLVDELQAMLFDPINVICSETGGGPT